MYVGKNNFQNDELSFKFANGKDMWFHANENGRFSRHRKIGTANELHDRTYEDGRQDLPLTTLKGKMLQKWRSITPNAVI